MFVLTACANMTPGEKKIAWMVGGVVVVGAIAASSSGSSSTPNCKYVYTTTDTGAMAKEIC